MKAFRRTLDTRADLYREKIFSVLISSSYMINCQYKMEQNQHSIISIAQIIGPRHTLRLNIFLYSWKQWLNNILYMDIVHNCILVIVLNNCQGLRSGLCNKHEMLRTICLQFYLERARMTLLSKSITRKHQCVGNSPSKLNSTAGIGLFVLIN